MSNLKRSKAEHDATLPPAEPPAADRRAWLGLAVIALPCLLYAMDLTVLNLALPTLAAELAPSATELLWIVDIYGFMVAGMLIPMGVLGDRIGRRRLLLYGAAAFGAASVLAATANSPAMLIVARGLLGIAGATLAPSTLSLIRHLFEQPRERSVAIGIWIASYSVGSAVGPIAGGLLLEVWGWQSVFLLAVPVMGLLLISGPFLLPEYRPPSAQRIDLLSIPMSITAVLATIHGIKRLAAGDTSIVPMLILAGGLMLAALFVRRQAWHAHPMIDLALFRVRTFSAAIGAYGLACFVTFGIFVFEAQYLQLVLGLSPLQAALWTTPIALAFVIGSMAVPWLARRLSPARLVVSGFLTAMLGFLLLALVLKIHLEQAREFTLIAVLVAAVLFSLGLSPIFTLATDLVVGSAPASRTGVASAISETAAEFGGALGIALLGSLIAIIYRSRLDAAWQGPTLAAEAGDTLIASLQWAQLLAAGPQALLVQASRDAFSVAFMTGSLVCAGLALAGAGLAGASLAGAPR